MRSSFYGSWILFIISSNLSICSTEFTTEFFAKFYTGSSFTSSLSGLSVETKSFSVTSKLLSLWFEISVSSLLSYSSSSVSVITVKGLSTTASSYYSSCTSNGCTSIGSSEFNVKGRAYSSKLACVNSNLPCTSSIDFCRSQLPVSLWRLSVAWPYRKRQDFHLFVLPIWNFILPTNRSPVRLILPISLNWCCCSVKP